MPRAARVPVKPVCTHPQRWVLGAGRRACRNCPLRVMQSSWQTSLRLPEAHTEPIPVYREPEPEKPAERTMPIPAVRDPLVISHPQIRPDSPARPVKPKGKPRAKSAVPSQAFVNIVLFVLALLIAALLYQIPAIGHP